MFVRYGRRIRRGTPAGAFPGHWHRERQTRNLSVSQSPDDEFSGSMGGDEDEEFGNAPWKTMLEMPARATWRVSTARLPTHLADAQDKLLNETYQTKKQLHKAYEDVMSTHKSLVNRRERERMRIVENTKYKDKEKKRDEAVHPVFYGPDETLANFKFRLHPNYEVTKRVLDECKSLIGRDMWSPKRVIDFGMGCGSASAASMDVWDDIEWIHGVDPSQTMREGAKAFLDDLSAQAQAEQRTVPRITQAAHLSAEASSTAFDLALFAYTATELPHGDSTLAAAAILWGKLRPGGIFVMIEPGTPDGFSSVRTVRNMLLDCCRPDGQVDGEEECHILAPCTHNGACPMERFAINRRGQDDEDISGDESEEDENGDEKDEAATRTGFCSFVQTMPGKSRSKGEKFSYIVAQKRICGESWEEPHPFDDVDITDLLIRTKAATSGGVVGVSSTGDLERLQRDALEVESRFLDSDGDHLGLELLRGDRKRSSFGRIIQAPKKRKGHVLIDCCVGPGEIVTHIIPKSLSKAAPGVYAAARKSRWGGYWPNLDHVAK
jgi:ribosomal protein RSM22 (predicted rRNA methylase)